MFENRKYSFENCSSKYPINATFALRSDLKIKIMTTIQLKAMFKRVVLLFVLPI